MKTERQEENERRHNCSIHDGAEIVGQGTDSKVTWEQGNAIWIQILQVANRELNCVVALIFSAF